MSKRFLCRLRLHDFSGWHRHHLVGLERRTCFYCPEWQVRDREDGAF